MAVIRKSKGAFDFAAYIGDAKTLLAFNLTKAAAKNLAGFTIQYTPDGLPSHYIFNTLRMNLANPLWWLASQILRNGSLYISLFDGIMRDCGGSLAAVLRGFLLVAQLFVGLGNIRSLLVEESFPSRGYTAFRTRHGLTQRMRPWA